MNNYYNLELNILSCLLQRPELMKEVKIEDKHFIKYKKIWLFMKSFYHKFGTFDIELMVNVVNNKYKIMDYIAEIIMKDPTPSFFDKYQTALLDIYNQKKEEKEIIEKIYLLSNELYNKNIDLEKFKETIKQIVPNF